MRILVVDDDPGSRAIVRRIASKVLKCATDEAANGLEGLECLERRSYALIVLDLQMPVLGGLDTLTAIRRAPALRDIPVVMLTGGASEDQVRQAASLGVAAYLAKPIDPARLSERLLQIAESMVPGVREAIRPGTSVVVICDSDASSRNRTAGKLAANFVVRQTDSGVEMLRLLNDEHDGVPIEVVLCGADTGLVQDELLVRQVRQSPAGKSVTLCAALPKDAVGAARKSGLWDGVMNDALPPEMFATHFTRVVTSATEARRVKEASARPAPPPAEAPAPAPASAPAKRTWDDDVIVIS